MLFWKKQYSNSYIDTVTVALLSSLSCRQCCKSMLVQECSITSDEASISKFVVHINRLLSFVFSSHIIVSALFSFQSRLRSCLHIFSAGKVFALPQLPFCTISCLTSLYQKIPIIFWATKIAIHCTAFFLGISSRIRWNLDFFLLNVPFKRKKTANLAILGRILVIWIFCWFFFSFSRVTGLKL